VNDLLIRAETPEDYPLIRRIIDSAFGQPNEGDLVEALRRAEGFDPRLSLVAFLKEYAGGRPYAVGHILFHPISIITASGEHRALSLAPLSVLPDFQRKGVGTKMVQEGLHRARAGGYRSVIVLGHPGYYPRFGFLPASRWRIRPPFDAQDEAFMALELKPGSLEHVQGTVRYPEEFEHV